MRKALGLARRGAGCASPNPAVGCVVVRDGRVVGSGWHDYGERDHAEVIAIREAGDLARGATAYVTLEPCCHAGRTPPCTDLILRSGISRTVVALSDPNPLVGGRGLEQLRLNGVTVDVGLMSGDSAEIIEAFACRITTGRPLVVSKVGMSLDGRIGLAGCPERRITSPEAHGFTQELRLKLDAILIGVGTILADDPELSYRGAGRKRRPLIRAVIDPALRTPARARILESAPSSPVVVFCGHGASPNQRVELERRGAEVLPVQEAGTGLDINSIVAELGRRDVLGVLVEGGSRTHWSFLSAGLIDKFYFFVAPLVLGGNSVAAIGGDGYRTISEAPRFLIRNSFRLGPDMVLETYPSFSKSILSPWHGKTSPSASRSHPGSSRPK